MSNPYSNNLLVYQRLVKLGVPPKTAAGAVGSLMGESGVYLNPRAVNKGDGSDGSDSLNIGQWNGVRGKNLIATAQKLGTGWDDIRAAEQHIENELLGSHKHVLEALKQKDDINHGADIWTRQYEVPANAADKVPGRAKYGHQFYQAVSSGDFSQGYAGAPGQNSPGEGARGGFLAQDSGATPPPFNPPAISPTDPAAAEKQAKKEMEEKANKLLGIGGQLMSAGEEKPDPMLAQLWQQAQAQGGKVHRPDPMQNPFRLGGFLG